jgi:hypothetical protein
MRSSQRVKLLDLQAKEASVQREEIDRKAKEANEAKRTGLLNAKRKRNEVVGKVTQLEKLKKQNTKEPVIEKCAVPHYRVLKQNLYRSNIPKEIMSVEDCTPCECSPLHGCGPKCHNRLLYM